MAAVGAMGLPLLVIQHPLGGESPDGVNRRVAQAVEQITILFGPDRGMQAESAGRGHPDAPPHRVEPGSSGRRESEVSVADEGDVFTEFVRREWCDGLPIVAPTRARVDAMLAGGRADGGKSLGLMAPLWRECDAREARRERGNGRVRAGLLPGDRRGRRGDARPCLQPLRRPGDHASRGAARDREWASSVAPSDCTPGAGLFGPGFRANATIGRAIRLILMNVGGGWPGRHDMATQGSPAKFSFAIAEREDASPWEPLHVALGFRPDQSVVTVYGGEPPHNVNDHVSTTAAGVLNNVSDVAATLGSNVGWYFSQSQLLVVLGPEHAATVAADGFTRADVQRFVFEHARLPLGRLKLGGMWGMHDWPLWMRTATDDSVMLPQVPSPADVFVMVAGGPGKHSAVVPNCTFSRAVSRVID